MNKQLTVSVLLGVLGILFLASCGSKKQVAEQTNRVSLVSEKFEQVIDSVYLRDNFPDKLSIKSKVHFKTPKLSDSFKMHIRLKKDSAIWISATYYRMEVARLLLMPDSVKMIDRKNGKYYIGDYKYIQNRFKVPLDFEMFQSVLLGTPFNLDSAIKIRSYNSRGNIILASLFDHWYDDGSGEKVLKQQTASIWIDPKTYLISKSKIAEYKTKKYFTTTYTDTTLVNGAIIPFGAKYEVKNEEDMLFTSEYLKVSVPEKMSMPFTISSKYEPIF